MDTLPGHLLNKVLLKTDLRALAMLCCTNKSLQSHIQNPSFASEYYSQIKPSLLHISTYAKTHLSYYNPHNDYRSLKTIKISTDCRVLGYCSGILLLILSLEDRLCLTNPVTKKFRFLTLSDHMRFPGRKQVGLVVNQIDRTTHAEPDLRFRGHQTFLKNFNIKKLFPKCGGLCLCKKSPNLLEATTNDSIAYTQIRPCTQSFKVVYIFEVAEADETRYGFEIHAGDSWTCSKTTLTCRTSKLDYGMNNPVYLDGSLHWLRNDGSIIAFDPETEKARLIQTDFPQGLLSSLVSSFKKMLFASSSNNSLTLVSANEEVIYVYALKNILSDPEWVLVKQIQNGVIDINGIHDWHLEAYNGKCLVLSVAWKNLVQNRYDRFVHVYDLVDNKWVVMGTPPSMIGANQDFFLFTPSSSSVVGLDEMSVEEEEMTSLLGMLFE